MPPLTFTERLKPIVIALVIFIVAIIYIILIFFDFLKSLASATGPMGDTIGGFFSPFIGAITLYYVYRTFTDQASINQHSRSTASLDILYKSIDRFLSQDVIEPSRGLDEIPFNPKRVDSPNVFDIFEVSTQSDYNFITNIVNRLNQLNQIANTANTLTLIGEHRQLINRELNAVATNFLETYHGTMTILLDDLQRIPESFDIGSLADYRKLPTRTIFSSNVNFYTNQINRYLEIIKNLETLNVIEIEEDTSEDISDWFTENRNALNFQETNRLQETNLFRIRNTR